MSYSARPHCHLAPSAQPSSVSSPVAEVCVVKHQFVFERSLLRKDHIRLQIRVSFVELDYQHRNDELQNVAAYLYGHAARPPVGVGLRCGHFCSMNNCRGRLTPAGAKSEPLVPIGSQGRLSKTEAWKASKLMLPLELGGTYNSEAITKRAHSTTGQSTGTEQANKIHAQDSSTK